MKTEVFTTFFSYNSYRFTCLMLPPSKDVDAPPGTVLVEDWERRRARVSTIVDSNIFEYATGFLILMLLGASLGPS